MTEISRNAKDELIGAVKQRYSEASKDEKTRILDEFVALTGFQRKHAVRVLSGKSKASCGARKTGMKIYNEVVREAVIVLWEAADRACSKRLKPAFPCFVNAMECHGYL